MRINYGQLYQGKQHPCLENCITSKNECLPDHSALGAGTPIGTLLPVDLTGEADGSPQVLGVPLPDMGSSEQVYGLAMRALYKRALTGVGSRIDFSMFRSSVSWHAINIPMTASFNKKLTRRGNTHEFFAPVSVFTTKDGFVYLAPGIWKSKAILIYQRVQPNASS